MSEDSFRLVFPAEISFLSKLFYRSISLKKITNNKSKIFFSSLVESIYLENNNAKNVLGK